MRLRTRGVLTPVYSNISVVNNGCVTGSFNTPMVVVGEIGEVQTTRDVVTQNYSQRRRNNEIIVNPFNTEKITSVVNMSGPTYAKDCSTAIPPVGPATFTSNKDYINGQCAPSTVFALFTEDEIEGLVDVASTACWAALRKEQTQMIVFVAELAKTISMLTSPLGNVSRFLTKVRADKNASPLASSRLLTTGQYLAREWLTYRYGWSQLYRDVFNTIKALEKKEETGLLRAFGNTEQTRDSFSNKVTTTFSSVVTVNFEIQRKHLVKVRTGIYYRGSRSTNDYLGVNPESLFDAVWEIIPYSFVVDWVWGVQPYLQGLIRHLTTPIDGSFTTVTQVKTCIVTCQGATLRPGKADEGWSVPVNASGTSTRISRTKNRAPSISPPKLAFNFKIQDILDRRVLDSLALIINQLGRK